MKLSERLKENYHSAFLFADEVANLESRLMDAEQLANERGEKRDILYKENESLQHVVDYIWQEIYEANEPVLSVASVEKLRKAKGEAKMTEHAWEFVGFDAKMPIWKLGDLKISIHNVTEKLNEYETLKAATEMLSAEDANNAARLIKSEYETKKWSTRRDGAYSNFNSLQAYANILEGK